VIVVRKIKRIKNKELDMASNYHLDGYETDADGEIFEFDRAVNHLNIWVADGETFSISFDGGIGFLRVPPGMNSLPIGPVTSVVIISTGQFNLIGVQA